VAKDALLGVKKYSGSSVYARIHDSGQFWRILQVIWRVALVTAIEKWRRTYLAEKRGNVVGLAIRNQIYAMPNVNTVKILNGLQTGLQAAGIDPTVLLHKSGLPLTLWSSGRGMVTTEQSFAFWRALGELSNDPAIGLKFPGLIPKEQHHPASIAAQHARTFRRGLQRFAPYKLLLCGEEMRLTERKEECTVEFNGLLSREFAPRTSRLNDRFRTHRDGHNIY
jgi:Arabinose-binding domain of AraC transcription regulator, N-term